MILKCPDTEWVVRLGPLERTNQAAQREQAEEGAGRKALEAANRIHREAAPLALLLKEGVRCGTGCGDPEVIEEPPEADLYSYELDNGHWFCIAICKVFGYKLACRRTE